MPIVRKYPGVIVSRLTHGLRLAPAARGAGRFDARNGFNGGDRAVVETVDGFVGRTLELSGWIQVDREQILGAEAQIELTETADASIEQAGEHQDDDGDGNFHDDEQPPRRTAEAA